MYKPMGKFAENLDLGKCVLSPCGKSIMASPWHHTTQLLGIYNIS